MPKILFYLFSCLAILSALFVVLLPKPARALLSLIVTMFSLSVIYILLGGFFIAFAHLIVYAGAVLVLFLFVIMLQGIGAQEIPLGKRFSGIYILTSTFVAGAFCIVSVFLLARFHFPSVPGSIVRCPFSNGCCWRFCLRLR